MVLGVFGRVDIGGFGIDIGGLPRDELHGGGFVRLRDRTGTGLDAQKTMMITT